MKCLREILPILKGLDDPAVLVTVIQGNSLGSRWILGAGEEDLPQVEIDQILAGNVPRAVVSKGRGLLLEPLQPGRLAPWIHFASQLQEQGKACVPALITEVLGDISYQVGETFAFDERSHGLVPLDGGLNVALHRATRRALEEGTPRVERFTVPGGELAMLLDPILP